MPRAPFNTTNTGSTGSGNRSVDSRIFAGSPEQEAIWTELLTGERNVMVRAVAGSGKTTTMVQYCLRESRRLELGFIAFNRHIATELQQRLAGKEGVVAMTYHQLGLKALRKGLGRSPQIEKWKVYTILDAMTLAVEEDKEKLAKSRISKLVSLAKQYGMQDRADLEWIVDHHDMDLNGMEELVLDTIPIVLKKCKQRTKDVDFDDMIWLPKELGFKPIPFDTMLVDECFIGDTPIMIDKKRVRSIRNIVESRYSGLIASYENGKTVYKKVIDWNRLPVRGQMLRITTRRIGIKKDGTRFAPLTETARFGIRHVICTEDHRFLNAGQWVHASSLKVGDILIQESHAPKDPAYQDKYKHGGTGKQILSDLMRTKNKSGKCGRNNSHGIIKHRGGNGKVSPFEEALFRRLGKPWVLSYAVTTGKAKGFPNHLKIDLANPKDKIAIELDGHSHQAFERKDQDKRKDDFLTSLGWRVIRMTNQEAIRMTDDLLHEKIANSPVDAEVIAIEKWEPLEPWVYDITVEDTHCYYANGVLAHNCQDTNRIQHWLALNSSDRVVCIGDPNQAIYGWLGADSKSMDRLHDALEGHKRGVVDLPLTLTRRCPKAHVRLAQRLVPQIKAMPDAPEGKITVMSKAEAVNAMVPGDMVLCRVNADLLSVAYTLLKLGTKVVVRGRDIGQGIIKLIVDAEEEEGRSPLNIPDLIYMAGEITAALVAKFDAIPNDKGAMRAASAKDRYDCLIRLADGVQSRGGKVKADSTGVKAAIEALFADSDEEGNVKGAVVMSTVHRGKGLEASRVWILRPDLIPHPAAKQKHDREQELNLAYVAITRAKFEAGEEGKQGEIVFIDTECGLFAGYEDDGAEEQQCFDDDKLAEITNDGGKE